MAWSKSGLFLATHTAQWGATQAGINLTATDGKIALWGSSITPNFATDTAYNTSPWNSGECSGAGYTTGGPTLASTTLTAGTGATMVFSANNVQLNNSTISSEGGVIYWPNKSNRLFVAIWWGGLKETQDGTFLITWNSNGIVSLALAP